LLDYFKYYQKHWKDLNMALKHHLIGYVPMLVLNFEYL